MERSCLQLSTTSPSVCLQRTTSCSFTQFNTLTLLFPQWNVSAPVGGAWRRSARRTHKTLALKDRTIQPFSKVITIYTKGEKVWNALAFLTALQMVWGKKKQHSPRPKVTIIAILPPLSLWGSSVTFANSGLLHRSNNVFRTAGGPLFLTPACRWMDFSSHLITLAGRQ